MKSRFIPFLPCLLSCLPMLLPAQSRIGAYMIFNEQEVPSFNIRKIYEDSRGYLWFGTKNGLFQYDGFRFRPYFANSADSNTLTSNSINDIEEDNQNNLWISTASAGVVRMNPFTGRMRQYKRLSPDSNSTYAVNDIFCDAGGELWFATGGRGIAHYLPEKDSFEHFVPDPGRLSDGTVRFQNEIWEFAADPTNPDILWAAGLEGLFRFHKHSHSSEKFVYRIHGKTAWKDNSFHCIYFQDPEHIWLGTWGGGLVCFNPRSGQFKHYILDEVRYEQSISFVNVILDILPKDDSTLYIASVGSGLCSFNKRSGKFRSEIDLHLLPESIYYARCLTRTRDGSIWAGAENYILHGHPLYNRFRNVIALPPPVRPGDPSPVFTAGIYDRQSNEFLVAMGHSNQLLVLSDAGRPKGKVVIKQPGSQSQYITHLFQDSSGTLYAGGATAPFLFYRDRSMSSLEPAEGRVIPRPVRNRIKEFQALSYDGHHSAWIACNGNQLIHWDLKKRTFTYYTVHPSQESHMPDRLLINDMTVDPRGHLWLASSAGLFDWNPTTRQFSHYYAGGKPNASPASNFITSLAIDRQNHVWLAPQYQGVQVFDPSTQTFIQHYSTGSGNPASHIDDIAIDSDQNVWCTSNNGLLFYNAVTGIWKAFNTREGLARSNLTGRTQAPRANCIFLGIDNYLYVFDPSVLPANEASPSMHVTGFDVLGKPYPLDTLPDYVSEIPLSHEQSRIDISFTGIELLYPDRLQFYYRLAGFDSTWKATAARRISFDNLKPGHYRFEVKAVNSDGKESRAPAHIAFYIREPFWTRTWFVLFALILFSGLLYGIYRYRVSQLMKLQQVKNKISADLHDELGSRLTNIQLLTQIARTQDNLQEPTREQLNHIQEEVQASAESLHEIVTNIRLKEEGPEDLGASLRRYASQIFEMTTTQVDLEVDDALDSARLPAAKSHDLLLIYKEALQNIRKHAQALKVQIRAQKRKRSIFIQITDDGCGFVPGSPNGRNGLRIMKERADRWKGSVQIESSRGGGCRLECRFPLGKASPLSGIFSRTH